MDTKQKKETSAVASPAKEGSVEEKQRGKVEKHISGYYDDYTTNETLTEQELEYWGEADCQKYETARQLHTQINDIRNQGRKDLESPDRKVSQCAVVLYFYDKLALRPGYKSKADTVGCCSLRVEHVRLSKENMVTFDFKGKQGIRYCNEVPVEQPVFENLQLFKKNKSDGQALFDELSEYHMNKYLKKLMPGLTAKVFRTYRACRTLEEQLDLLTKPEDLPDEKIKSCNRAIRAVAILLNHKCAVPQNFSKQMENLITKINTKMAAYKDAMRDLKAAEADVKSQKTIVEKKEELLKLMDQAIKKEMNKGINLDSSKLYYCDPRIIVAWCKKWDIPVEKIYTKSQRQRFAWAMATEKDFRF